MFDSRWRAELWLAMALFAPALASAQPTPKAPAEAAATGQLTKAPAVVHFVDAPYPAAALEARTQGSVQVLVTIDVDGSVSAAEVALPAGHGFDEAALAAVKAFRFSPAEIDGQPASVQIVYTYAFTLKEEVVRREIPTGVVRGVLLERGTRAPLIGLTVRLTEPGLETVSDAEGRFEFVAVPPGEVTLLVEDPDYTALEDVETVEAGKAVEVKYYVERSSTAGNGVTVVGHRVRKEVTRRTLEMNEIRTLPGTNGDALKVVQNMPGVARIPFGFGDIILRGGGNTEVYVNRHTVPQAFHFGGLRSVVASELIESLQITPGNYGAEYGHANGGIVDIRLRRPKDDGVHGFVQADVFDAGAMIEGPIGEHGALAVAGRRSYIDALFPLVLDEDARSSFSTAPRYYDGQAIYDWKKGAHQFTLTVLGGHDEMVSLLDEPDVNDPAIRDAFEFKIDWISVQTRLKSQLTPDIEHLASVGWSYTTSTQGVGKNVVIDFDYQVIEVRDEVKMGLLEGLDLRVGVDLALMLSNFDITAPQPPGEGQPDLPLAATEVLHAKDSLLEARPAIFAEAVWKVGDLTLTPGIRGQYERTTDELLAMPRLSTHYQVIKSTAVKAGAGLYSQSAEIDKTNKVFGNPNVKTEKSWHYSAGIEHRFTDALSLDLTGFYKDFFDQVAAVDDPAVKYLNMGRGRAYGMEMLLRHTSDGPFYGWLAYTLQKSERRDGSGGPWRPFDLDQTHNLTVVAQYKLSTTWELGARFRYVTGNPQTGFNRATFDSDNDVYLPHAGAINGQRLDAFHQLDLRVDKHWIFDTWRMTTYLDVQNVYNRENPEGLSHNFDYTQQATVSGLPIIPSFGVRGEF
ncbi:MAG: TonB family protein [Bradymonadia bacterium]|jgi:TonB family protein